MAAAPALGDMRNQLTVDVAGESVTWAPPSSPRLSFDALGAEERARVSVSGPYIAEPLEVAVPTVGVVTSKLRLLPLGWPSASPSSVDDSPWGRTELHIYFHADDIVLRLETSGALVEKAVLPRAGAANGDDIAANAIDLSRRHGFLRDSTVCVPDDAAIHYDDRVAFADLSSAGDVLARSQRFRVGYTRDLERTYVETSREVDATGALDLDPSAPDAAASVETALRLCEPRARDMGIAPEPRFSAPRTIRWCSADREHALWMKLGMARALATNDNGARLAFAIARALDSKSALPGDAPEIVEKAFRPRAPERPDPIAHAHVGSVTASGPLGVAPFKPVIEAKRASMAKCYAMVLERAPKAEGTLRARFSVGADGRATWFEEKGPAFPQADLVGCAFRQLLSARFPDATEPTTITMEIVFSPSTH